ncbi:hypothetical protein GEMRC1_008131 [Eukaryota sp. GEM-RC1]
MSSVQRIAEIEAEIARTQKNKATNAHVGLLKAKLAKLKREVLLEGGSKSGGGGGRGFDVQMSHNSRISLVGFPSVGKSSLLTQLTGTASEAADYEFTTLTAVPGVLEINGAKFQLLDLPGIIEGANDGKGRGRQVIGTARTSDLILIVLDATKPWTHKKIIEKEMNSFGLRLNKTPPDIKLKKKDKGGICITSSVPLTRITDEVVNSVCKEYRLNNVDVNFHQDATVDELIDVIEGNRVYMPCRYVLNKIDAITIEELDLWDKMPNYIPISVHREWNLDLLKDEIWDALDLVRVYTKPKGKPVDFEEPVVISRRRGAPTVKRFVTSISKALSERISYAYVWGKSVKFQGMKVGRDHVLEDEDICQFRVKN